MWSLDTSISLFMSNVDPFFRLQLQIPMWCRNYVNQNSSKQWWKADCLFRANRTEKMMIYMMGAPPKNNCKFLGNFKLKNQPQNILFSTVLYIVVVFQRFISDLFSLPILCTLLHHLWRRHGDLSFNDLSTLQADLSVSTKFNDQPRWKHVHAAISSQLQSRCCQVDLDNCLCVCCELESESKSKWQRIQCSRESRGS